MPDDPAARIDALEARIRDLEREVGRLRAGEATPRPGVPTRAAPMPPPPTPAAARVWPPPPPAASVPAGRPAVMPASETVLKWGGVTLVVLAVGFAVSTAISRGWIGPELQLAGAVAVAFALIGTGLRLRPTRMPWTHALCSGGVAALYTTFASDLFIDQADADIAFAVTVAVAIGGYGLARLAPSEWVGVVTLAGGLVAWLVVTHDDLRFHPTLGWIAGLVAVALIVSLERQWFGLRLLAHAVGMLAVVSLAGEAELGAEQLGVVAASAALYGSLMWVPSIGDLRAVWQELEIQLAAVAAPFAFGVVVLALDLDADADIGWTALDVAIVTALLAVALRPRIRAPHVVSLVIGASVSLTIALAMLLSTAAAFVGIGVQGAGLVVLSRALGGRARVLVNAAVLLVAAGIFAVSGAVEAWTDDAPAGDDLGHLAVIVALAVAVWQSRATEIQPSGFAVVLVMVLIWLGSVLVHLPEGQAVVSGSWAAVGTALLVTGAIRKLPEVGGAGLAVLALTVGKLLVVDMQEVDTLWRAALFCAVGLGLLRLGFLLPRWTGLSSEPE